jgi:acetyl esterase/lipase
MDVPTPEEDAGLICKTLTYAHAGETALQLELCMPAIPGTNRPGVLCVHGGGWQGGGRQQFKWHARDLARRGFVAATMSYRLVPTAQYPAQLDDCQKAMRWMRKHAEENGMDPARLGAMGSSAGGHLVALLGVRDTRDDSDPALQGVSSKANCVVDIHGVHDMPALLETGKLIEAVVNLIGGNYAEKKDLWEDASPQRFVDATSAPMLVLHDPGDPSVPYQQSVDFAHKLMAAARPVLFIPAPGAGHGFFYSPQNEWTKRAWPDAVAWFTRHLA